MTPEWPRFAVRLGTDPRWGNVAIATTRVGWKCKLGAWVPRSPGASVASLIEILQPRLARVVERQRGSW